MVFWKYLHVLAPVFVLSCNINYATGNFFLPREEASISTDGRMSSDKTTAAATEEDYYDLPDTVRVVQTQTETDTDNENEVVVDEEDYFWFDVDEEEMSGERKKQTKGEKKKKWKKRKRGDNKGAFVNEDNDGGSGDLSVATVATAEGEEIDGVPAESRALRHGYYGHHHHTHTHHHHYRAPTYYLDYCDPYYCYYYYY